MARARQVRMRHTHPRTGDVTAGKHRDNTQGRGAQPFDAACVPAAYSAEVGRADAAWARRVSSRTGQMAGTRSERIWKRPREIRGRNVSAARIRTFRRNVKREWD